VLAGQGVAQYKEGGRIKYLPYHRLFAQTEKIKLPEWGTFEAYANRDSLSYEHIYGLDGIKTLIRATLRREGFCRAWNVLVQLGLTDDTTVIHHADNYTYRDWLSSYLSESKEINIEKRVAAACNLKLSGAVMEKLKWLGLFSKDKIEIKEGTAAQILQHLIEKKWVMKKKDKDMIVMVHDFIYKRKSKAYKLRSSLVVVGDNAVDTAMAKTVGLPLGMLAMRLVRGECKLRGVHIPVMPEVYDPVLKELRQYGISFLEVENSI
jgi:saccharopine dehydrogenase (NADP+, L-glutamate forming)